MVYTVMELLKPDGLQHLLAGLAPRTTRFRGWRRERHGQQSEGRAFHRRR
jgi:hypothetical protein